MHNAGEKPSLYVQYGTGNHVTLRLMHNSSSEQAPCEAWAKDSFGSQNSWLQRVPPMEENQILENHENYKDQKRELKGPMSL